MATLRTIFPFSLTTLSTLANLIQGTSYDLLTADSMISVKAVQDANEAGVVMNVLVTDQNVQASPTAGNSTIMLAANGAGTGPSEFDPWQCNGLRVSRGGRFIISIYNGSGATVTGRALVELS